MLQTISFSYTCSNNIFLNSLSTHFMIYHRLIVNLLILLQCSPPPKEKAENYFSSISPKAQRCCSRTLIHIWPAITFINLNMRWFFFWSGCWCCSVVINNVFTNFFSHTYLVPRLEVVKVKTFDIVSFCWIFSPNSCFCHYFR